LLEEDFEITELKVDSEINYKNIKAEKIIFCDGIQSSQNPLFKNLPFALNKGEALLIEAHGIPSTHIFKKGMMLTSIQKDLFWLGSNYLWEFPDDQPTEQFRKQTELLLRSWLKFRLKL
jgi:hypothetical protein